MIPRFRFAPSPTGIPHVGNLHTALFCWALARAMKGDFIIRIEDSDAARNDPQAAQRMLDALAWLGIDWDEGPDTGGEYGPYVQSERLSRHRRVIEQLLDEGHAYYGDDPDNPAAPDGNPLRLRLPREGQTVLDDAIRGPISFENKTLEDRVIVRSDGRPLYHLAAMVDDHDMAITHVVRGEEWIASAPIHVRLYHVMGWQEPVWIHLPLILNKQGQKLKKRDAEGGYRIDDFQATGYLPEALFNYLLLLGWAPENDQEIVSKWDIFQQFHVQRLSSSPAIFDWDKLNWINRQYIQKLSNKALAERLQPYLEEAYGAVPTSGEWLPRLTAVIREEVTRLQDAVALVEWAFVEEVSWREDGRQALATTPARPVLLRLVAEIAAVVLLDEQTAHTILSGLHKRLKKSEGWKASQIFLPIRAALTGTASGPPLPKIMGILGKERTLQRVGAALRDQS